MKSKPRDLPAIAEQWRHLVAGALALDYDARMQVRQLVAETFERIVIYHCGIMPETGNPHIDLVLMAKGGTPRMLRIDRKSGAWMAQEYGDVVVTQWVQWNIETE